MDGKPWHGPKWPEGVPFELDHYEKSVSSMIDETARRSPDATYTIFAGARRTFARVRETADRLAAFLAKRGIEPRDRVAIFLPNLPHYPEIFFGILKAGAIAVTCNPLYKPSELNFQLKDSGSKAIFVMDHPLFYANVLEAVQGTDVETVVICNIKSYLPPAKRVIGSLLGKIPKADTHDSSHLFFDDAIKSAPPKAPDIQINPLEDPALILYTGGTTGIPKGATLSHSNLMANVIAIDTWAKFPDPPGNVHTYLGVLPWYHSFGLTTVMLWSCLKGARLVCIPDPRAGKPPFTDVLGDIQKHRVTLMTAVPTIYSAIVHHPLTDKFDLTSIIACASGAAPLPAEVIRQFEEKTGAIIFEGYGLTETSPVATINPTNVEQRSIGSAGLPLPGTDVKIIDLEGGDRELPLGEDGEIAVYGPQVMLGYWNKPEVDETVFRMFDGRRYFLTGDIGHIDNDGFLIITDRKKDLILVGGFNAYPREIEEVLYTHPKVAQAAVIGIPNPRSGESIKAFVQLAPGAEAVPDEIIQFCREKLAGYKCPKEVEFRESLPTSVVGKVLRRVLREEEMKIR